MRKEYRQMHGHTITRTDKKQIRGRDEQVRRQTDKYRDRLTNTERLTNTD